MPLAYTPETKSYNGKVYPSCWESAQPISSMCMGEHLSILDGLSNHGIQGFNGIGRVDYFVDVIRIIAQCKMKRTVTLPDLDDSLIFLIALLHTNATTYVISC